MTLMQQDAFVAVGAIGVGIRLGWHSVKLRTESALRTSHGELACQKQLPTAVTVTVMPTAAARSYYQRDCSEFTDGHQQTCSLASVWVRVGGMKYHYSIGQRMMPHCHCNSCYTRLFSPIITST